MELTKKELSNIIYEANRTIDCNPMTRLFADMVAKDIIECEKRKIKENLTKHNNDFKAHKSSPKPCPRCIGTGLLSIPNSAGETEECPTCKGQGFLKS